MGRWIRDPQTAEEIAHNGKVLGKAVEAAYVKLTGHTRFKDAIFKVQSSDGPATGLAVIYLTSPDLISIYKEELHHLREQVLPKIYVPSVGKSLETE